MSAKRDAADWAGLVSGFAGDRGLRYEPVGGINARDAPPALCVGGANRLTGELADGYWGSSCDAEEHQQGGFGRRAVLPRAVLAKAHMPDLAKVVPVFNVESLDRTAEDVFDRHSRRRVDFESIDFNRRFITTVPADHDPVALRELFSPAFLEWTTRIDRSVDFGITDRQFFFLWRLRERTREELETALNAAGGIFRRLRDELQESGFATYPAGPWHAGLEAFP